MEEMEKIAVEFIEFLQEKELFDGVCICANRKLFSDHKVSNIFTTPINACTKYGKYYIYDDIDVEERVEYANPDALTVTFEGPLYDVINYGDGSMEEELNEFFGKYKMYMEQGYAWSFATYAI